jgi:hypothetical protein
MSRPRGGEVALGGRGWALEATLNARLDAALDAILEMAELVRFSPDDLPPQPAATTSSVKARGRARACATGGIATRRG